MDSSGLFSRDKDGRWGRRWFCVRDGMDWIRMKVEANKATVSVEFCYRPPSQDDDVEELFFKELRDTSRSSTLVLKSDFNLLDVNWEYHTADINRYRRFLKYLDNFVVPVLREPIQQSPLLVQLLANRECLMGEVANDGHLGHSDHEVLNLKSFMKVGKLSLKLQSWIWGEQGSGCSVNYLAMSPSKLFEGLGVHQCWTLFKYQFLRAQEQAITICWKSCRQERRLACLSKEILIECRWKKKVYCHWKWGWANCCYPF